MIISHSIFQMQTALTPDVILNKRTVKVESNENDQGKIRLCFLYFPLCMKIKIKLLFLGKYQVYFISCGENISISLVLRSRKTTDFFTSLNKIYLVFTSKK